MIELRTDILGCELPSPLVLSSGPRSWGARGIWEAFRAGAGAVVTKTIRPTLPENPTPHIDVIEVKGVRHTLINAEEWSDVSWEAWVEEELPSLAGHPGALVVSVGHAAQDIAGFIDVLVQSEAVDIIECVSYSAVAMPPLVKAVRRATDLPILVKLSFNWGKELYTTAEKALEAGCNGFTAIDSIGPALQIDIESGQPSLGSEYGQGWLSGAAVKPIALAVVASLKRRFDRPVVGTGGVLSAEDVIEMTMAGADAVGVCSASILYGYDWFSETLQDIEDWLREHGHPGLAEIRGCGLRGLPVHNIGLGLEFHFDPMLCTLCQRCVEVCPYKARQVLGTKSRDKGIQMSLDAEKCRSCGLCSSVCVSQALTFDFVR